MREILFRGQLRRKGEKVNMAGEPLPSIWVYGGVAQYGGGAVIYQAEPEIKKYPVYGDTVGQYIGAIDKNGKKIFEGDFVQYGGKIYEVKYVTKYMRFSFTTKGVVLACFLPRSCEIVGNIYENPELMEVQND